MPEFTKKMHQDKATDEMRFSKLFFIVQVLNLKHDFYVIYSKPYTKDSTDRKPEFIANGR